MTVLIVDDERPAVEAAKVLLDWEALGFDTVLIAHSMGEAAELLSNNTVHIMVCDIEMPGGSGIELTQWAGMAFPAVQTILLTAHQRFDYAKKAISLGVLEYLLKPVKAAELEGAVMRAAQRAKQTRQTDDYLKYGDLWLHNQQLVSERFWLDVINGIIPANNEDIGKLAVERSISYLPTEPLLPVLLHLRGKGAGGGRKTEQQAGNMLQDALKKSFQLVDLLLPGNDWVCAIAWRQTDKYEAGLKALINELAALWAEEPSVYIGEKAVAAELTASINSLARQDRDNVLAKGGLFKPGKGSYGSLSLAEPDYRLWSALLREGRRSALWNEIDAYHKRAQAYSGIDARFLLGFHHNFQQMLYQVLEEKGIPSTRLLSAMEEKGESASVKSLKDLFSWAKAAAKAAEELIGEAAGEKGVIDRVDQYIQDNLAGELSRDELAAHVYLNPDYLSRLIKKETGLPLSEYVQRRRMEMAASLLAKTDMSVSEAALAVGYRHFSQFSKIFQKHIGQNPKQYRQNQQK